MRSRCCYSREGPIFAKGTKKSTSAIDITQEDTDGYGNPTTGSGWTDGLRIYNATNNAIYISTTATNGINIPGGVNTGISLVGTFAGAPIIWGPNGSTLSSLQPNGSLLLYPQRSTTGVRYLCVDTTGHVVSQAAACSGT